VPIFFGNLVAGLCIGWYARAGLKRGRAAWPGGAGKAPRPTSY
jgi:hypothetical protein